MDPTTKRVTPPLRERPVLRRHLIQHLGVAYHYSQSDDRIDPFFDSIQTTYDGPVAIAQDLTVINVTPEQIVVREAQTDLLHDTPPGPDEGPPEFDPKNPGVTPDFVADTVLPIE